MTLPAYGTYVEADTYFENRLHVTAWLGATQAEKTKALIEATSRVERLRFAGFLVDDDQELEFPRYYDINEGAVGTEEIPDDIKIATYELAFTLLDGVDPDLEFENLAIISHTYSSVKMTRSPQDTLPHIVAGIPSATAWRYLLPYLAPSKTIRIRRVS